MWPTDWHRSGFWYAQQPRRLVPVAIFREDTKREYRTWRLTTKESSGDLGFVSRLFAIWTRDQSYLVRESQRERMASEAECTCYAARQCMWCRTVGGTEHHDWQKYYGTDWLVSTAGGDDSSYRTVRVLRARRVVNDHLVTPKTATMALPVELVDDLLTL